MQKIRALIIGIVLACAGMFPATGHAVPQVSRLEVQSVAGLDRVMLHSSHAIGYNSFTLDNPARLVIDMTALDWRAGQGLPAGYNGAVLKNIRVAQFNPTTTRMVLDLAQAAKLKEVTVKNQGQGFVVAFDVLSSEYREGSSQPVAAPVDDWATLAENAAQAKPMPDDLPFAVVPVPVDKPLAARKPVVVIDAGHGGRDPGAIGVKGTHEKEVTLAYARALRDALLRTGRYDVVLTRDSDTYIMLRERLAMGRRAKGDIFISLHADAAENHATRGLSVYTLSETASDAEAAALATRENKVDLIYGMNLSSENPDVTEILIDLAQRETKNKSSKLANILVENVSKKVQLLRNPHRYAGFAVLKAPDVPSVLVEIGFLSNRKDEALITSSNYRAGVVASLVDGIDAYFEMQRAR